jgi:hypothetical protein
MKCTEITAVCQSIGNTFVSIHYVAKFSYLMWILVAFFNYHCVLQRVLGGAVG